MTFGAITVAMTILQENMKSLHREKYPIPTAVVNFFVSVLAAPEGGISGGK